MSIVSLSLPDDLIADMDRAITDREYRGRSEFMRAAIRALLQQHHRPTQGHVHGSITMTYPHSEEVAISDTRHAFHDVVLSLMHTHCEPETCMDVLIVGGDSQRILLLQESLSRMRKIHRSHLELITGHGEHAAHDEADPQPTE